MNQLFKNFRRLSSGPWSAKVRFSSVTDTAPDPSPKPKAKRKSTYVSVAEQIRKHFGDNKIFVANFDRLNRGIFRRRPHVPLSWSCFSDATAETLFQAAKVYLIPDKPIVEIGPGLGLLTEKLLSLSPSRLYAFESDSKYREILSARFADHPELTLFPKPFMSISKETFKQKVFNDSRLAKWLPDVEPTEWKSDTSVQIIGAAAGYQLFQYIVSCITFQHGLIAYGRPELYVATQPEIYVQLTYYRGSEYPTKKRRFSKLLLFSIYCDVEILGEVDAKSFIPWYTGRTAKEPVGRLLFLRAVPKRDLLDTVTPKLLKPLWFFVNQAVLRPRLKVIPYFEKWIPGCGPLFIAKGLSVFTEFVDLSPAKLLEVFLTFANLPDYEASLFDEAVDAFVFKKDSDALGDIVDETSTEELAQSENGQSSGAVESVKPQ